MTKSASRPEPESARSWERGTQPTTLNPTDRRSVKQRGILWATGGLLLVVALLLGLRLLGHSAVSYRQLAVAAAVTVAVQGLLWLIPALSWDRALDWDPDYVYLPMTVAALLLGYYVYLGPEVRYFTLMGWLVALLFVTGLLGFVEVVSLALLMTASYVGAIGLRVLEGTDISFTFELVRAAVFLAVNFYAAGIFQRLKRQRSETRRLREELAELAITDPLTGLPNRRYLEDFLHSELERIHRYGGSCAVAMIDVDDFKNYNDTLGHMAGDEVLRDLADVFRAEIRVSDVVARYGGEEFGLIMVNTGREEALEASERLRGHIEDHPFDRESIQPQGQLTVSIGVASCPEDGETYDEIIRKADEALYRAKESGKYTVRRVA